MEPWPVICPSDTSLRTVNPIRRIVEGLRNSTKTQTKAHIALSLGDPTTFGNFPPPTVLIDKVIEGLRSGKHNGYIHSAGTLEARKAVAAWCSSRTSALSAEDVVITSGCSGALDLAISVLANPGDNMLIPQPAFALYQTLAESKGIEIRRYRLLPDQDWQADLAHMSSLVDERTRAILVNNPSNPCGSVYSEAHLRAILEVAERHRIPIISDEVYGDLVFEGSRFFPIASLSTRVPIISVGGLAKEFLVPGWRVGWVCVHDRCGALADVRKGLYSLSQLILGANSLVVSALSAVLCPAEGSKEALELHRFHATTVAKLQEHSLFAAGRLAAIPGLRVNVPQGAMYLMFGIEPRDFIGIANDEEFTQKLLAEENVLLLPGAAFCIPNYIRVVICAPVDVLGEAIDRVAVFCARHRTPAAAVAAATAAATVANGTSSRPSRVSSSEVDAHTADTAAAAVSSFESVDVDVDHSSHVAVIPTSSGADVSVVTPVKRGGAAAATAATLARMMISPPTVTTPVR